MTTSAIRRPTTRLVSWVWASGTRRGASIALLLNADLRCGRWHFLRQCSSGMIILRGCCWTSASTADGSLDLALSPLLPRLQFLRPDSGPLQTFPRSRVFGRQSHLLNEHEIADVDSVVGAYVGPS